MLTIAEDAPLLNHDNEEQSLISSLMHPPRKLTNLEKLLAAVSIILLILMSTFIGLFATAERHLKNEQGHHGGGGHGVSTTTEYATRTTTLHGKPTGKPEQVSFGHPVSCGLTGIGGLLDCRVCQAISFYPVQLEHLG
jgi:endothelin-converting enzyme